MSKLFSLPKGWQFLIVSVVILSANAFGQTENLQSDLRKSFGKFDVVRFQANAAQRAGGGNQTLSFAADGREFRLELSPRNLLSPRYRAEDTMAIGERELARPEVKTFKGRVAGEENSAVRITLDGEKTEGFFVSNGTKYFIESARNFSKNAAAAEFVVYRAEDHLHTHEISCDAGVHTEIEAGKNLIAGDVSNNLVVAKELEMATEADYEFVNSNGSAVAANDKILSILNMVEGIYQQELTLSISVVFQHTYTAPDPFDGTNEVTLLNSFRAHWNANYPYEQSNRDAAHLFSYKANIQTRGFAFIREVCKATTQTHPTHSAYGISGRVPVSWGWEAANVLVTAHEIAHNLGAEHNDTSSCTNTLMNTNLSGDSQPTFCSVSRTQMFTYMEQNGGCLAPRTTASTDYDFEGDGKADQAVFRPSNGVWYVNQSSGGYNILSFGQNGDKPVSADYDGDGKTDFAVYRGGSWFVMRSATNSFYGVGFGNASDIAAPADFDGDAKADVAVFRQSTGGWFWLNSGNGSLGTSNFGTNGDVPVPADYDGDGKADVNIFRPSSGNWFRLNSGNGAFFAVQFGQNGDKPLIGDFDGDAKADVAIWRPSDGGWYVLQSGNGSFFGQAFGLPSDIPTPADFDGDGKTDVAVYRPSSGYWYRFNSGNGSFASVQFGVGTDIPAHAY